jgi:hypothetical protein
MPDFTTEIDIDPYEYVSECSKREIKELIECLIDEGHINSNSPLVDKNKSILDEEWDEVVGKILSSRLMMSPEDEQMIRLISKKY